MKVGVVGCGYWGPNLIRNVIESNRCSQVFCFDTSRNTLARITKRFPSVSPTGDLDELIDQCDAVVVATPVAAHYDCAKRALLAGKSVLVEKPLTASSQQAEELIELADDRDLTLMVGHTFVYSPAVRKVKQYITNGSLGDIYFLSSSRVNLGIHRSDVNVIWDLAPHDLSMLIYWLGEAPCLVSAMGRACVGPLIDVASIHCEFPSGTIANIEVSWLSPSKLRRTVVVGSRQMVVYDDSLSNEKIKLYNRGATLMPAPSSFGEYQLMYRDGDMVSPCLDSAEPLLTQMHDFLDAVEQKIKPESDAMLGLQVVRVLEATSRSMQERGRLVEVETAGRLPQSSDNDRVCLA